MRATTIHGPGDIRVEEVPDPSIKRPTDAIVKVAYHNFVREPLRTFARDEVQRRNGLEVKDALISIGDAVLARIQRYAADSPFVLNSVVVGNVQYPEEVAMAVSRKPWSWSVRRRCGWSTTWRGTRREAVM